MKSLAHRVECTRAVLLGLVAGSIFRQGEMALAAREYRESVFGALSGCELSCLACRLPECHLPKGYSEARNVENDAKSHLLALRVYARYILKRRQHRWLARRGKVTLRSTTTTYEMKLFRDALEHAEALTWR